MSVVCIVVLKDDHLPSLDAWQRVIDEERIDLKLDKVDDLRLHAGYLPARLDGDESGFEWYYGPIGDVSGDEINVPEGFDHAVEFVTHSDSRELKCAMLAAGCLAKAAGGLFINDDTDTFISGDRVFELIKEIEEAEKKHRIQQAALDAEMTDRRCPSCGAPCPTYRKTCKACGVEVGRSE